jgi:hypothetical protein
MELVPNASISFDTVTLMPETNAEMTMTVDVPTTTPRMVRNVRSLLPRSVSRAMAKLLLSWLFIQGRSS